MSNTDVITEKVYCSGQPTCGNNDLATMLAANGGGFGNNPWMYLIFLAMFGGNGLWGNRNGEMENANSRAIASLANQVSDNHNSDLALQAINGNREALGQLAQTFNCDINTIQQGICGVKSAIEQVGGAVGYSAESVKNAIALGDANIVQMMQSCCCQNKELVQRMGYENQIGNLQQTNTLSSGINEVRQAVVNGFANLGFQQSQDTAAIINAQTASTQRILDQMCANTTQSLRDTIAEKDRQLLASTIVGQIKNSGCACGC